MPVRRRIAELSTTTGTGNIVLLGNLTGFKTFASAFTAGQTDAIAIEAIDAYGVPTGQWELVTGTFNASGEIERTTFIESSTGSTVNFSAGNKRVFVYDLGGGTGDVIGPASAVDNALARFDTTTGKLIQSSSVSLTDNGEFILPEVATPATPAANTISLTAIDLADLTLPVFVDSTGYITPVQPSFMKVNPWMILPNISTTPTEFGVDLTVTGTVSHPALASTNILTQTRAYMCASSTTAGTASQVRSTNTMHWRGNATGLGGFKLAQRFGWSTAVAQQRSFLGLHSLVGSIANVNPSTLLQMVGFGYDSAQTTLRVFHNDGSGAATAIDLGANFPVNNSAEVYDGILYCVPNSSQISYQVTRLSTGHVAKGALTTDLPTNTTFLCYHGWVNNGTTAAAAQVRTAFVYGESNI